MRGKSKQVDPEGKLMPQAVEVEQSLLGILISRPKKILDVISIVRPDFFYKEAHRIIFSALASLFEENKPIDIVILNNELKDRGVLDEVGGPQMLWDLTNADTGLHGDVAYLAKVVADKWSLRNLAAVGYDLFRDSMGEGADPLKLEENFLGRLVNGMAGFDNTDEMDFDETWKEVVEGIQAAAASESGIPGINTGFRDFNRLIGGWVDTDLLVLGARPGMGKTALMLCHALAMLFTTKKHLVIFSIEMSKLQLVKRLISIYTGVSSEKIKNGNLSPEEWQRVNSAYSEIDWSRLHVFEHVNTIQGVVSATLRLKMRGKCDMIMIDYLQLLFDADPSKRHGTRDAEVGAISRALKQHSKRINVPTLALAQLNRGLESRGGDKEPKLMDLRESGSIEQDADIVYFLYRPEYYGYLTTEDGQSLKGVGFLIVAKNRHGSLDRAPVTWQEEITKFSDYGSFTDVSPDNIETSVKRNEFFDVRTPYTE